jgi:hypothetical protein
MQEMKHQPKKRVPRKRSAKTPPIVKDTPPEERENEKSLGKMKTQEFCAPLIGRSVNYVERVGLGTLRVIHAEGVED